jgi:hypothetical protein
MVRIWGVAGMLTLLVCFGASVAQTAEYTTSTKLGTRFAPEIAYTPKTRTLRFYDLTVVSKGPGHPSFLVQLGKKTILKTGTEKTSVNMSELIDVGKDFPEPGMDSIMLSSFNERYTDIETHVVTKTPEAYIVCSWHDPEASNWGGFDLTAPPRTYVIPDEHFGVGLITYNGVELTNSPSTHAPVNRLAVFDSDTWRMDRVGEFPGYYNKELLPEAREAARRCSKSGADCIDSEIAQAAIIVASYQHMAGKSASACLTELRTALPENFKPVADAIMADIVKQANSYAPLTVKTYPIAGGKGAVAASPAQETGATPQKTVGPGTLPTKIGSVDLDVIAQHSKGFRIWNDYTSKAQKSQANKEKAEVMWQAMLDILREVVENYARQNGYQLILERNGFARKLRAGTLNRASFPYYDETVIDAFLARIQGPDGRHYAEQLNAQNLDNALIPLLQ